MTFKLWNAAGSLLATSSPVTVSANGIYSGSWVGVSLSAFAVYYVSAHAATGYTFLSSPVPNVPAVPFVGGNGIVWLSLNNYFSSDGFPSATSGSQVFPVEPIIPGVL